MRSSLKAIVLATVAASTLAACGHKQAPAQLDGLPRWTRLRAGQCPASALKAAELEGKHWCAVGQFAIGGPGTRDEHLTVAENNARAALARSIETAVKDVGARGSKIQGVEAGTEGTTQLQLAYQTKAQAVLRLVAIQDTAVDKEEGLVYALAVVDNGQFRKILADAFRESVGVVNLTKEQKIEAQRNFDEAMDELDRAFPAN